EAFARLPAADRRSVARGSEDRVTAGPTVGGRERETQSKDTMRVCGGGRAPLANANVAGDCGRAQRLEPRFARRHAVQHLVAQVPLFGPAAFPAEVESQKSGVRMRSIRSLPCAPAFVPSAFCSPPGSASTGQNPVTATSYNAFSEVTGVTFGSGDSEAFVYDPGTGRMTIPGVTGPYYDSNGNVIKDGFHSYTWDAEGLPHSVDSLVFTYGALGRAVEDSGGTQLVYNPQGGRLGFMSGQTFQTGRVPLMAGAWARYLASGLALYRHPDWLGSVRLSSTPIQGQPYYDGAYAPYGESYAEWGTTDHQFTGQKEDTVGDLYDFPFREYHSTQGRWLRPDPAGLAAVDPTNPQSLNRYSYVLNNPTGLVDPLGLGCQPGTA